MKASLGVSIQPTLLGKGENESAWESQLAHEVAIPKEFRPSCSGLLPYATRRGTTEALEGA